MNVLGVLAHGEGVGISGQDRESTQIEESMDVSTKYTHLAPIWRFELHFVCSTEVL